MFHKICALGLILVVLLGMLTACGTGDNAGATSQTPLKVGSLSMMTMLPLYVAQQEGLFTVQGLNVEIIPFASVLDRDTALHAGQLDIIVDDIFSGILLNKDVETVKVVAVSPVQSAMFYVIAAADSGVTTAADLKNVEVAVSLKTIIDYATEKLLTDGGLASTDIKMTSIPSMPLRLEMMNQGKITAGTFSRPLADAAVLSGNKVICDDGGKSLLTSSIMAASTALKDRPGDVKKFLTAWKQATQKISTDPQQYNSLLIEVAKISSGVAATISVPKFDVPRAPTPEEFQSKADWMFAKGLTPGKMTYDAVVSKQYLPK